MLHYLRRDFNVNFPIPKERMIISWNIALAVYGTTDMAPEPYLAVVPR
ncbi:MAG: hypothetical protein GX799_01595 [Crenarchaeota archaeon]|nr:hypothetical protein [Thermoproteota archaeon]